jgi:transcriptional regulator with XRE-family HTH domain
MNKDTQRTMNKDFPRVMTLLRKEHNLSQKTVANDLGITQALLSHYEKGKRECGLDFLVRAADYYGVSVDYLLGRTSSSSGITVSEQELPESSVSEKYSGSPAGAATAFKKKLITNALEVVFQLLMNTKNGELAKAVCNYLSTAVYRSYRMVYSAGKDNDENSFAVPAEQVSGYTSAEMSISEIKAGIAAKDGSADEKITTARIEQEYPKQSAALFSIVSSAEKSIELLKVE